MRLKKNITLAFFLTFLVWAVNQLIGIQIISCCSLIWMMAFVCWLRLMWSVETLRLQMGRQTCETTKSWFRFGFCVYVLYVFVCMAARWGGGEAAAVVRNTMTPLTFSVTTGRGDRGLRLETLICSSYDPLMDRDSSQLTHFHIHTLTDTHTHTHTDSLQTS